MFMELQRVHYAMLTIGGVATGEDVERTSLSRYATLLSIGINLHC
jgi:hypothetical protein